MKVNVVNLSFTAFLLNCMVQSSVWATPANMQISAEQSLSQPNTVANTKFVMPDQAMIAQLSTQDTWRRLLLYVDHGKRSQVLPKRNAKVPRPAKTYIDINAVNPQINRDFFVSAHGDTDPQAELVAMLQIFAQGGKPAHDLACRFPARTHWLQQQLQAQGLSLGEFAPCQDFQAWFAQIDPRQFSLLFAEEHSNNSGSAFGHTLIRVDNLASQQKGDAYAFTINFATDEAVKKNAVQDSLGAIRGGNDSAMRVEQYQEKIAKYLANDGRDIWQYKIKLTQEEMAQIVRHVWEVKDLTRPYFFTHNNCASEILRLIDIARPQVNIRKKAGKTVIPAEVVRVLDKANLLESKQKFIPSNRTYFQAGINQGLISSESLKGKTPEQKQHVWANYQFPNQATLQPNDNNPRKANDIHRLEISTGQLDKAHFIGLQFRAGYHDLLDQHSGVRNYLDVQALSIDLRLFPNSKKYQRQIQIQDITMVRIRTLNPTNSAEQNKAFGGHLKLTRVIDAAHQDNNDHLVASAGAEVGKSWVLGQAKKNTGDLPSMICYTMAHAALQVGKIHHNVRFGVGPMLGCAYHTKNMQFHGEIVTPYWYQGKAKSGYRNAYLQPMITIGTQYNVAKNHAFRFNLQSQKVNHDTLNEYKLSYLHYF